MQQNMWGGYVNDCYLSNVDLENISFPLSGSFYISIETQS